MLSTTRDEEAATGFFKQSIENNGMPEKVVIDKSGANYAGLMNINTLLRVNEHQNSIVFIWSYVLYRYTTSEVFK